ncbi:MAG TPA: L,D-transpeptidase family protein [Acidimicrobiia bacterium]|nr:L,D-transpeptidase family protein [Acidimicrobiia bacterium]
MLVSLVVAALLVSGFAVAGSALRDEKTTKRAKPATTTAAPKTTTTTAPAPTTTTLPPTTIIQPPWASLPPVPGGVVGPGSQGPEVQAYEQRMVDIRFDPGPVDGIYDQKTAYAAQTLQKYGGGSPTGRITDSDVFALNFFQFKDPMAAPPEPNRTEVDITGQTLTLYENYQPKLITTVSSGSGENYCYETPRENPTARVCEDANTPSGRFTYTEFRSGWDKSPLGQLYNPYYFNKGIAVHGYESVPTTPASHGCVRIPMHISEYFHDLVSRGDAVYVFGGEPANVTSVTPIAPSPLPPTSPDPIPPPGQPA